MKGEYKGRTVTLEKPMRDDSGRKKYKVYVKNDKGNVVVVRFGDPNMEIKRDDPKRRKSFRARHRCSDPGPKWKARYWACKFWEKDTSVTELLANAKREPQIGAIVQARGIAASEFGAYFGAAMVEGIYIGMSRIWGKDVAGKRKRSTVLPIDLREDFEVIKKPTAANIRKANEVSSRFRKKLQDQKDMQKAKEKAREKEYRDTEKALDKALTKIFPKKPKGWELSGTEDKTRPAFSKLFSELRKLGYVSGKPQQTETEAFGYYVKREGYGPKVWVTSDFSKKKIVVKISVGEKPARW